jgi:AraC-like DNA-binding protein
MRAARDTDEFLAAPIGRYVVGRTFVAWCATHDLVGTTQWGEPDESDVRAMIQLMDIVDHPELAATGCVLMDCREIERVALDVLMLFVEHARRSLERWASRITRQAVIIPHGLRGLLLAAPLPLLSPGYPFRFAVDLDDAIAFLEHPDAHVMLAEIDAIAASARGVAPMLARLRAVLARDLVGATVKSCARALASSTRSLQRELGSLETSFSAELRRARVEAAVELLRTSDMKVAAIANSVGFGTASRMNVVLRSAVGMTARELRARR